MKKVLSLVLVIAMVLSSMSFAFASTFEDVTGDYEKAIDTLSALGVIDGYEDGTYRPEKTVTRAEMAKLMVITLGYGDLVAGSKSNFADTQGHWADAYIALAAGKGIVIGDGNGKFRPDDIVSYDEVLTMIVRGLGYTDDCNELKGMTWPTNFKVKAAELDITDDVAMKTSGADRGGVAQALYNALTCALVTVDVDGNVTTVVDSTSLVNGVLVNNPKELLSRIADLDEDFDVTEAILDPDNKNYAGDLVNLEPYMFQNLDVYTNDDDYVVYVRGTNSLVFEGKYDSLKADGNDLVLAVLDGNGKTQKYTFDTTIGTDPLNASELFVNGEMKQVGETYNYLKTSEYVKIVANEDVSNLDNGKIDNAEIDGFVLDIQTRVGRIDTEYVDGKAKLDVFDLPVDSSDDVDNSQITVEGEATALEDVKANDIVVEYAAFDSDNDVIQTKLVVSRNTVEGKVTRVDTSADKYYVDGVGYELSSVRGAISSTELDLGHEGVFYLDQNDMLVDYDGEAAGPTDYAVVVGVAGGTTTNRFNTSIDEYPQLKLATQDDETIIYDIQVKMDTAGAVSGSAKYTNGNTTADIVPSNNLTVAGIAVGDLVKYKLNSDGRISKVEVVDQNVATNTAYTIDLDKASNALVEEVIVFDGTLLNDSDNYNVVDKDALPTNLSVLSVQRNSSGDIEVIVAAPGAISTPADVVYAYLNKVNDTYDSNGDEVSMYVMYTNGQKLEIFADDNNKYADGTYNHAMSFEYDGDVISDTDVVAGPIAGNVATATAINASGNKIKLNIAGTLHTGAIAGDNWYALSERATIVGIDSTVDATPNSVIAIRDLYDIDENDQVTVYVNGDKEIDLIIIVEK